MPDGSRTPPSPARDDLERITAMYREHYEFIARLLGRCGVPDAELEDATQETFLVAYRRLADFEGRAKDRTWLYAIAVRVASTLRRSRRRESARRAAAGAGVHAARESDPEAELTRAQAAAVLEGLLQELDANKRTVFVLCELEGLKAAEVSQALGLNVRTVYSRLRLARRSFDAAVQRFLARERGLLQRAQLRARPLADRAEQPRPPRRAAMAALVARIKSGAIPTLPGWQQFVVAAPSGSATIHSVATAVGLAAAGLSVVAVASRDSRDVANPPVAMNTPHETAPAAAQPPPSERVTSPAAPVLARQPAPAPVRVTKASPKRPRSRPVTPPSFDAELALIERARVALRQSNAAEALAALDEHERLFAKGQLVTERNHTRIKALCTQHRVDEATSLARRLAGNDGAAEAMFILGRTCRPKAKRAATQSGASRILDTRKEVSPPRAE